MFALSLLFFAFASICNAIMDVLSHHYITSVFSSSDFNKMYFWNAEISWKNKYINYDSKKGLKKWIILGIKFNKPVQFSDAWHLFKMFMIIFLALSVITYEPISFFNFLGFWNFFVVLLVYGIVWNCTFSLFYNKIFIKK